jgi:hypothetical protein
MPDCTTNEPIVVVDALLVYKATSAVEPAE